MLDLTSPAVVKDIMHRYRKRFKKSLGQNFLIDGGVLDAIVEGSGVCENDAVLEIGPGIGSLTQRLALKAKKVAAVEIDSTLIPLLGETLEGLKNVEIVNQDIIKADIDGIIRQMLGGRAKVAANLPYYITTPILMRLLEHRGSISSITVTVQKEVAERITADKGCKAYGALSVAVQFYSRPTVIMHVPPHAFMPMPKVHSTVIRLDILPSPAVEVPDESLFFKVVRAAFAHRRKTFVNSAAIEGLDKTLVASALCSLGFSPNIRGEMLGLEEFAAIARKIMV